MYCGEATLVKSVGAQRTAVTIRCRAWTCPDCAPQRQSQLIAEAKGGAPTTFLTLTRRVDRTLQPIEAAKQLAHAWRLLRLRTMRRFKLAKLPFLAVFQSTKAGWPHLHIVLRAPYIDQAWLSQNMAELCDSPVVDIRRVDNPGRVGAYVARYIARATEKFGTCKRYWQSQDYDLRDEPESKDAVAPGEGWERDRWTIKRIVQSWKEFGWAVRWTSHRTAEATIPP